MLHRRSFLLGGISAAAFALVETRDAEAKPKADDGDKDEAADKGDARDELYARIGRLRSDAETRSFVELSGTLNELLDKPIVRDDAKLRLNDEPSVARTRLKVFWSENHHDYIARALLQPYAALLREKKITPDRVHSRGHCPFCGGTAWISSRKSAPDAESGFRYLGCSLCGLEWNFGRIACPACGEEDPHKLPIFRSDAHKTVRLETCETCRRYVKSIDLTLDARPIPPVDDLVSLSMDLWAAEEGYTRIEPGMAGI